MLKIKPHSVTTEKGDAVDLLTAVECKGIVGNDGRHYLLDLLRMTPPDLNYLPGRCLPIQFDDAHLDAFSVDVEHLSPSMKQLEYPKTYKHRLCCLRQELIDAFIEYAAVLSGSSNCTDRSCSRLSRQKYVDFYRSIALNLSKLRSTEVRARSRVHPSSMLPFA